MLISECYSKGACKLHGVFQPQKFLNKLFPYLDSVGIVQRVDSELPSIFNINEDVISALEYKKKLAGYVKTKSLMV